MGRGDRRTAKGKRFKGSFGNTRKAKPVKKAVVAKAPKVEKKAAPKARKKKEA